MAPRLSATRVARIENDLLEPNMPLTHDYLKMLASSYHVSLQTMYHHKWWVEHDIPPAHFSGGPRPIITWEMTQAIKLLLDVMWLYTL